MPVEGEFAFAKYGNTNELEEIQTLLEDSVKEGCEGLMVKMLDGPESYYEPSKRSQNWLKVKKDYLAGVGDSLDLVVLGAYYGKGKRTSWYGAFLLACYNPSTEKYETVCNIGTGFSEAILETLHKSLSEIVIDRPKPFYTHSTGNKDQPDVWFEPRYVWEVKTADLTLSPRYKAAAAEVGGGGKGVSLRFPRFIKERDDKKPDQASSSRMIADMYQRQESVAKNKGPSVDDDFEYWVPLQFYVVVQRKKKHSHERDQKWLSCPGANDACFLFTLTMSVAKDGDAETRLVVYGGWLSSENEV